MRKQIKKLLAGTAVAIGVAGISAATVSGYHQIRGAEKVEGASITADQSKPAPIKAVSSASALSVSTIGSPKAKEATSRTALPKLQKVQRIRIVTPNPPAVPLPSSPVHDCFVAAEEGIYVPRNANTGSITLTADRPVYWRTLSNSMATSDAGAGIPSSFPAYIVLESAYDPAVATTSISFHLHGRPTAPLGEYCPADDYSQVGIAAFTVKDDESSKVFDIPMNINIVESLTPSH